MFGKVKAAQNRLVESVWYSGCPQQLVNPFKPSKKTIETIKKGYFAVIQYSGWASKKNFIKHSDILRQKLIEDKISVQGFAIKATYNAPFTPPPFRRNEAMFRIDWNK